MNESELRRRLEMFNGARVPQSLLRLALWYSGDDAKAKAFDDRFSWGMLIDKDVFIESAPVPRRSLPGYYTEPVELIPIFGCYTVVGFLDLAPEVGSPDTLPVVLSNPNDYECPVRFCAADLAEALALSLYGDTEPDQPDLREVFGFPIVPIEDRGLDVAYQPKIIPAGYRYVQGASNATGVLAPLSAFREPLVPAVEYIDDRPGSRECTLDVQREMAEHVGRAQKALADGYPATTILIAKDFRALSPALWHQDADDHLEILMTLFIEASLQLGRPGHAAVIAGVREEYRADRRPPVPKTLPLSPIAKAHLIVWRQRSSPDKP
jgi:hypothetical protein